MTSSSSSRVRRRARTVVAVALAAGGALVLAWGVDVAAAGGASYGPSERVATPSHALLVAYPEELAYEAAPSDVIDAYLVEAVSRGGKPLFVGVGRADRVLDPDAAWRLIAGRVPRSGPAEPASCRRSGYLSGVSYAGMVGPHRDPFTNAVRRPRTVAPASGSREPAPPRAAGIWADSDTGESAGIEWRSSGTSYARCEIDQMFVVVMNADGSSGVAAEIRFGIESPLGLALGVAGVLIGGAAVLAAALLLALGRGHRRADAVRAARASQ